MLAGNVHVDAAVSALRDRFEVCVRGNETPRLGLKASDQGVELANVRLDTRDQERIDGGEYEMDVRLLATAHDEANTADSREVVALLQEKRGQHADNDIEIRDDEEADVGLG